MSNWLKRFEIRQRELERGADADLVFRARKRRNGAIRLCGFAFLLIWLSTRMQMSNTPRLIIMGLGIASISSGFIPAALARQEKGFLNKPHPEEPPIMFKR